MKPSLFLLIGSTYGGLGVAIGAFGAHRLEPFLREAGRLDTWEKAVHYQFYHALGLLAIGLLMKQLSSDLLGYAGWAFTLGVLFFSGSLYVLCLSGVKTWGAVTPIGGLLMIAGWVLLAWAVATGK